MAEQARNVTSRNSSARPRCGGRSCRCRRRDHDEIEKQYVITEEQIAAAAETLEACIAAAEQGSAE